MIFLRNGNQVVQGIAGDLENRKSRRDDMIIENDPKITEPNPERVIYLLLYQLLGIAPLLHSFRETVA
jgi:hypothetical protein